MLAKHTICVSVLLLVFASACAEATLGGTTDQGTGAPDAGDPVDGGVQPVGDAAPELPVADLLSGDTPTGDLPPQDTPPPADTTPPADVPPAGDGVAVDAGDPTAFAYLIVEPTELDFGDHPVGAVDTRDLELENAGTKGLTLTSIALVGGSEAFATNLGQAFLGPGQKKTMKVTFYALDAATYEDVIRFESNAINDVQVDVPVRGAGIEPTCEDSDGDGHGKGCGAGSDCNDSDPQVFQGAPEQCNGADDDCDGLHDEDFVGLGAQCQVGFGACVADGFKICASDEVSLECSVNPVTGGDELCNTVDDDCDGATDEDFPSKGKLCSVGVGACEAFDKYVCNGDGTALVCNVQPGEPQPEICYDGIDNDCDGITDEGELEVCGDGIDNDCDGETDETGSTWGEVFFARNYYGETVAIYPSNGDGTFGDAVVLDFPGEDFFHVVSVGDFDGDKYLDPVVSRTRIEGESICAVDADCPSAHRCSGGVCRKYCNTGAPDCAEGQTCIDHDWDNLTNDTFCRPGVELYIARSSCEGDLIELTPIFELEPGEGIGPIVDTDNNGHLDFVGVDNWKEATGFVWLNDGAGGYTKTEGTYDYSAMLAWSYGFVRTSKDVTGDGVVDMLGKRFDSGGSPPTKLFLFVGQGDGTFAAPKQLGQNVPYPANLMTMNDFDGDADQDLVAGCDDDGQPGAAWMLLNLDSPDGAAWVAPYMIFDVVPTYNSGGEHPGIGYGTSFDFDGDDRPDVLAAWIPEECGSYVWGCSQIGDPAHLCYGGYCRKVGIMLNQTTTACLPGTSCIDGQCQAGCTPDCEGKLCGTDGCGGTCGVCGGGQTCTLQGQCVVDCVPDCAGKVCGDNGCGGICGACPQGDSCLDGQCQAGCVPSCAGKVCGDDGCGGRCAVFTEPQIVTFDDNPATNVTAPTNVPPTMPQIQVQPVDPTAADELTCAVVTPSYDLDAVTYRFRWYRDDAFVKELGEKQLVPPTLTAAGETWKCRVRATDGIEWSPGTEAQATLGEAPPEDPP